MAQLQYLHQPVDISPSLHTVQCSDHEVQPGVEGVTVDVLSSRTHLVEVSIHLQVWVDAAGGLCRCGTLRFLRHGQTSNKVCECWCG